MNETLLIVEDEHELANLIAEYARASEFIPQLCHDGQEALSLLKKQAFNLVILDLMLPSLDGLNLCRQLRGFSDVPVIMVTAKVEEIDRLIGLEIGADDYLCKPFSPRELMARCKTIFRRVSKIEKPVNKGFIDASIRLDASAKQAYFKGAPLELTRSEFLILQFLNERPGQVISRLQLLDALGDDKLDVTDRAIDSHIKNLRRKILHIDKEAQAIHSIYGLGYRFDGVA